MADVEQFKDDLENNSDGLAGEAGATSWKRWAKSSTPASRMGN